MGTILPSTSGAMLTGALGMLASFIPYEKRVHDVSACGTYMTLKRRSLEENTTDFANGSKDSSMITIEHFANDKAPFTFEQIQRKQTSSSFNGKLIFFNDAPLIKLSVSVIPNTKEDVSLMDTFNSQDSVVDLCVSQVRMESSASNAKWPIGDKAKGKLFNVALYGGVIESGPPGASSDSLLFSATTEGRLESHTYTFVFSSDTSIKAIYAWKSDAEEKGFLQSLKDKFTKG